MSDAYLQSVTAEELFYRKPEVVVVERLKSRGQRLKVLVFAASVVVEEK